MAESSSSAMTRIEALENELQVQICQLKQLSEQLDLEINQKTVFATSLASSQTEVRGLLVVAYRICLLYYYYFWCPPVM